MGASAYRMARERAKKFLEQEKKKAEEAKLATPEKDKKGDNRKNDNKKNEPEKEG